MVRLEYKWQQQVAWAPWAARGVNNAYSPDVSLKQFQRLCTGHTFFFLAR